MGCPIFEVLIGQLKINCLELFFVHGKLLIIFSLICDCRFLVLCESLN